MPKRVCLLAAAALAVIAAPALAQQGQFNLLEPMGPIARAQRQELIWASAIIMIAVLPVIICTPWVFWRYRRSNPNSSYTPNWAFNTKLELVQWGVPIIIVIFLSIWLAQAVFRLDPYRTLDADMAKDLNAELTGPPVAVDVIGLDWKWLFVYPEQGVASVGELVIPVGRPIQMRLTTDTVMQSFMAPGLAGQIYAMAGMQTQLNLLADRPGTTIAENTQYNGTGFASQRAPVRAVDDAQFNAWVVQAANGPALTEQSYAQLAQSSDLAQIRQMLDLPADAPVIFDLSEPQLFDRVLARYRSGQPVPPEQQPGSPAYDPQAAILPAPIAMGMGTEKTGGTMGDTQ